MIFEVLDTLEKATLIAHLADEKKAEDICILDVRGLCNFTDAFVLCTGNNRIQLNAISDGITSGLRRQGLKSPKEEGERGANWLVLDCADVVVHIMSPEARSFYRLEKLWGDAAEVDWQKILTESPKVAAERA